MSSPTNGLVGMHSVRLSDLDPSGSVVAVDDDPVFDFVVESWNCLSETCSMCTLMNQFILDFACTLSCDEHRLLLNLYTNWSCIIVLSMTIIDVGV